MKIAVTSQNRRTITEHAGRCRKFWIFEVEGGMIVKRELLEVEKEHSLHESAPNIPREIDGIDVFITAGMGPGLVTRLARNGIEGLVTDCSDPEEAVSLYLSGTLPILAITADGDHHPHE